MSNPQASVVAVAPLLRAPHRLLFLVGAGNLLLAMLWWATWLAAMRWDLRQMPALPVPAGWLHAVLMQYLVLPSFIFGFLLTVFPRWMALPELSLRHYLPVGTGLMGGQLALLLCAAGWKPGFLLGLSLAVAGWSAGLFVLGRLLRRESGTTWHARSCFVALIVGYVGLLCFLGLGFRNEGFLAFAGIKLGGVGLLLPIYLTVAHRMFPFFAANIVPGYRAWRPMAWLAAVWLGILLHLALELAHAYAWLWLADAPLFALTGFALWRWWPRGPMPGLLAVLFIGALWLPVAFLLHVVQSAVYLVSGEFVLGRAPMHALFVGFFGSILVAMVTRVTQGHSGRPLVMTATGWFAFVSMQAVATMRVVAEIAPDAWMWQALAAAGWIVALLPWVVRIGWICLTPRADGRPG